MSDLLVKAEGVLRQSTPLPNTMRLKQAVLRA